MCSLVLTFLTVYLDKSFLKYSSLVSILATVLIHRSLVILMQLILYHVCLAAM
jgi:hypothetical protein